MALFRRKRNRTARKSAYYAQSDSEQSESLGAQRGVSALESFWKISPYLLFLFLITADYYIMRIVSDLHKNDDLALVVGIFGIGVSIVVSFIVWLLVRDKSEANRKINRTAKKLKASESFLTLMMDTIPDRVFVKDEQFRIIKANSSFLTLYPPEKRHSIIGTTTIENFPKKEADAFLIEDRRAFDEGISQIQETVTTYEGVKLTLLTTKVRFKDVDDKAYILGISRDITDLIDTQKTLEQQVEERTAEFKRQREIAEKAGRAKEEFLASMSHELRTPLNSIIGLAKILMDERDLTDEQAEMMNVINEASDNLLRTVNDILDISKIESGNIPLEKTPFDLSITLHNIVDQTRPLASQKGLDFYQNLDELGNVYIIGDSHRLTKIITNLTSNAVKYTEKGHVKIEFGTQENNGKTEFKCAVSDTGVGIPKNRIEKIFDKFTQAQESTERRFGGTGLGLSITKQLVTLMDGEITVESTLGEGSTFTVTIPYPKSTAEDVAANTNGFSKESEIKRKTPSQAMDKLTKSQKDLFQQSKILIAEDHVFNKVLLEKLIGRIGIVHYDIAEHGGRALELYESAIKSGAPYDLVLMDCHMPYRNGYEAAKEIRVREQEQGRHVTPIVAMTADVMVGAEEKCLKAGMNDYISKPINEPLFRRVILKWLSQKNVQSPKVSPVDLSLIEEYADHDFDTQKELLGIFYTKSLQDLEDMKEAIQDTQSVQKYIDAAHGLKGSAGYIGAKALEELCNKGQNMVQCSSDERTELYESIVQEHAVVCSFLKKRNLL